MPENNNTQQKTSTVPVPLGAATSTIPASEDVTRGVNKDDVKRIEHWMIAVVIFVVVSFLGTFFLLLWDFIKEKDLYLQYDKTYTQFLDRNSEQQIKINDLENQIRLLKASNPYLK